MKLGFQKSGFEQPGLCLLFGESSDPVVRKPIKANPQLKVNRGFQLAR